ncbi:MAG: sigma-70 family RNA polymerase sigma factor [Fimbriimonadaceae bacterium]|nr:sigma-70 family RNA polymerase sigma factor [Fimbriimonadaceae bacterium]
MDLGQGSSNDRATELALVERCRKQDDEAFAKLVDVFQNRLFGFVRRMVHDREEAMDITQETFIRAYQSISRFDGRSSLRTWLFRIAHNLCIDRARKADRRPIEYALDGLADTDDAFEVADSRWNPETGMLDDELRKVVEDGVAGMSEKLRSVLLLHDRESLQYEEIAEILKIPIGTVKSRLFLARAHLQQVMTTYLNFEGSERR